MEAGTLLDEIENFMAEFGIGATAFGLAALNDGKFVFNLRDGRRCWPETANRVREYIRKSRIATIAA